MHDHIFQLDLDGQVTCSNCGCMDDERDNSGSYNGRRVVSETNNEGPIPSPEALLQKEIGYSTGKWSDDDDIHPTITPLFGPNR